MTAPNKHVSKTAPWPFSTGPSARLLSTLLFMLFAVSPTQAIAVEAVDVLFVLDNSGSMKQNDPDFLTRRAVADFAETIAQDEQIDARIALVLFDSTVRLAQPLTPIRGPATRSALIRALGALDFSGQRTNSPAGIERAIYELRENGRERARKAIIFLTDGKIDTGDSQNDRAVGRWLREDLAEEAASSGIRIFGVAFTEDADYQLMQALAQRTRARYYRAFEASQLSEVVADVLARVDKPASYDLAYLDSPTPLAAPVDSPLPTAQTPAASARLDETSDHRRPLLERAPRLLAWLPALLFLGATAIFLAFRRRRKHQPPAARGDSEPGPPAQLLDFGGQLGETGASIALSRDKTTIGRDPHNNIVIGDDTVSSEHAFIEVRDGRYWLQDLRSTNGTRLANKRIVAEQRYALKGGDRIRFADVDLMFVVEGYVPGGDTVYLSSSTTPPPGWTGAADQEPPPRAANPQPARKSKLRRPSVPAIEPAASAAPSSDPDSSQEIVFAEARERLDPASVADLDSNLPAEELPDAPRSEATHLEAVARADRALAAISDEDAATGGVTPREPVAPDSPTGNIEDDNAKKAKNAKNAIEVPKMDLDAIRGCLDYHLDRVAEISPDFSAFVERGFGEELRTALPVAAKELMEEAFRSGEIGQRAYTFDRIRYVICGIPGSMDRAQDLYVDAFGGFTRVLTEQLQSAPFRADRCEFLALLSFGYSDTPWVSLSIVPDEGRSPRIDLLTYEFLTEAERQEIEPESDIPVSQSGPS